MRLSVKNGTTSAAPSTNLPSPCISDAAGAGSVILPSVCISNSHRRISASIPVFLFSERPGPMSAVYGSVRRFQLPTQHTRDGIGVIRFASALLAFVTMSHYVMFWAFLVLGLALATKWAYLMYACTLNKRCFLTHSNAFQNPCSQSSIQPSSIHNPSIEKSTAQSQNILIVRRQNILHHRLSNSLERLMRLALRIIVLHILHRGKRRLDRDIVPLVPRVVEGLSHGRGENVGFAVLES